MSTVNANLTYNYKVVRQFAIMTVVWGIVGMALGVLIAAQLVWPSLNLDLPFTHFGRLRPLHTNAVIFGFNVRADTASKRLVEQEGLDLRYYSIIYNLIDDVKAALTGMLKPEFREDIVGIADVRDVFRSPKFGQVAGCMVTEGTVYRNKPIRVLRDNVVIFEGELESLRRFKDDVAEVRNGMECGIGVKGYDVKVGDQIEVFDRVRVERQLESTGA